MLNVGECVCQDLKDFMRQAGEVVYADAHRIRPNEGFVSQLIIATCTGPAFSAPALFIERQEGHPVCREA